MHGGTARREISFGTGRLTLPPWRIGLNKIRTTPSGTYDWDAAQLALLRDKLAHVVRLDRGNYNGVISEQIKQQTPNHTKVLTARIRRKPSDMVHMLVEVAQLLVYWRHTNSRFGNNSIGAKYDKKMAERCV